MLFKKPKIDLDDILSLDENLFGLKGTTIEFIDNAIDFVDGNFFPEFAIDNKSRVKRYFSNILGAQPVKEIYPVFKTLTYSIDLDVIRSDTWSKAASWQDQFKDNSSNVKDHAKYICNEILMGKYFREYRLEYPEARRFIEKQNPRQWLAIGNALRAVYGSRDFNPKDPVKKQIEQKQFPFKSVAEIAALAGDEHLFYESMRFGIGSALSEYAKVSKK